MRISSLFLPPSPQSHRSTIVAQVCGFGSWSLSFFQKCIFIEIELYWFPLPFLPLAPTRFPLFNSSQVFSFSSWQLLFLLLFLLHNMYAQIYKYNLHIMKKLFNSESIWPSALPRFPILPQQPPECSLDLFVPQGVYNRVECRSAHGIEETKELAPLLGIGISGLQVDSNDWAVEEGDHHEVGGTGPESFPAPFRRVSPEHCPGDGTVRDKDEAQR